MSRTIKPSALKRLKDTYKSNDVILPPLERHVMRTIGNGDGERSTKVMHPSDMSHKDWCGRHDYYRIIDTPIEKTSKANPSFRMENVFAEGHAIHDKYQTWLWEMGVLFGDWLCLDCGHRYGALSPTWCQFCRSPRLVYKELPLRRKQILVEATPTLPSTISMAGHGLVEIKSIGVGTLRFEAPRLYNLYEDGQAFEDIWWKISRPFNSHIRQGQLYLWMSWPRYEEIVFIYESKAHQQTKEFVVGYNKNLIAPLLETAREVTSSREDRGPTLSPCLGREPGQ